MCILYHIHNDCIIAKYDLNTFSIPYCNNHFRLTTTLDKYNRLIEQAKTNNNWLSTSEFYSFIVKYDINLEYISNNAVMLKKKLNIYD